MTNMMHKVHNWQLIPIDHSLAFRNRTGWPRYYKKPPLELSDEAKRRLQSLTAANLQAALGDLLDPSQIEFVLKRRDLLVAGRTPK